MKSALSQRTVVYQQLAAALRAFADEHGLPNRVSPSEMAVLMQAPSQTGARLLISRIFTSERIGLNRELAKVGLSVTAYAEGPEGAGKLATIEAVSPTPGHDSI
ncbi:hypothetical protein V5F40_22870 [Xanthobacter sp. DSM 14520]|uniref:hypothetical protein n=1 Tax=Xanthobacter autotrophicus (strain ATCC BAA-1158 / Py2) TaxID=78245 RepID=UPI00372BDEEC